MRSVNWPTPTMKGVRGLTGITTSWRFLIRQANRKLERVPNQAKPPRRTPILMYDVLDVHHIGRTLGFMSWPVRPMTLVVGGIVRPDDVVGRIRDAEAVAASLPHSGAVLVGDRRHGKTSL